jgi:hypothetical protein
MKEKIELNTFFENTTPTKKSITDFVFRLKSPFEVV